jgi:hypothetical protein
MESSIRGGTKQVLLAPDKNSGAEIEISAHHRHLQLLAGNHPKLERAGQLNSHAVRRINRISSD